MDQISREHMGISSLTYKEKRGAGQVSPVVQYPWTIKHRSNNSWNYKGAAQCTKACAMRRARSLGLLYARVRPLGLLYAALLCFFIQEAVCKTWTSDLSHMETTFYHFSNLLYKSISLFIKYIFSLINFHISNFFSYYMWKCWTGEIWGSFCEFGYPSSVFLQGNKLS